MWKLWKPDAMYLHVNDLQGFKMETKVETKTETASFYAPTVSKFVKFGRRPPSTNPISSAGQLWSRVPDKNPFTVLTIRREAHWVDCKRDWRRHGHLRWAGWT
jgi:hypothetical protein